jgi:hypothetical protein
MFKKMFTLFMLMLMVAGVTSVVAAEDDVFTPPPIMEDGRINAYDPAAPVALFYTYDTVPVLDENGNITWDDQGGQFYQDIVTGIDILAINSVTGDGSLALRASVGDLAKLVAGGELSLSANGVNLNIGDNGWFWVEAPTTNGDYTFSWDDLGRTLIAPIMAQ